MWNWLRNDSIALLAIVAICTVLVLAVPSRTEAAPPADPELCDPWKMAGGVMVYRCEDDSTGVVCYANGFGFIYCVEG